MRGLVEPAVETSVYHDVVLSTGTKGPSDRVESYTFDREPDPAHLPAPFSQFEFLDALYALHQVSGILVRIVYHGDTLDYPI